MTLNPMKTIFITIPLFYVFISFSGNVNAFSRGESLLGSTNSNCYRYSPKAKFSLIDNIQSISRSTGTKLYSNSKQKNSNNIWNGAVNLWNEIIEVSTYGPSERKMLKLQRERERQLLENDLIDESMSVNEEDFGAISIDDDREWMNAFAAAARDTNGADDNNEKSDFDGYALRDLLVSKWGVSLDIEFQRIGDYLYCTILPLVGYGSPLRSRHNSELDYLMHLQGVIEILEKYDNLGAFIEFVITTNKIPKRGTDSIPFRLTLSDDDCKMIMQQ